MKNSILAYCCCFLIISVAFMSGWFGSSLGSEELEAEELRKSNRDYEFVDIAVGCKCGNKPFLEVPYRTNSFWPVEFTCAKCDIKYVITRDTSEADAMKKALKWQAAKNAAGDNWYKGEVGKSPREKFWSKNEVSK